MRLYFNLVVDDLMNDTLRMVQYEYLNQSLNVYDHSFLTIIQIENAVQISLCCELYRLQLDVSQRLGRNEFLK